ncbi:MAG: hypothetical protein GX446_01475 [Chthonomonadales bacterium]|nr:hypothetical protein [Chthonomonadales bacterium]
MPRNLAALIAILALAVGTSGCAPRPARPKPAVQQAASKPEIWECPLEQTEGWEPHGHERLSAEARAVLDRKYGSWSLEKDQTIGTCRALWLNIFPPKDEPWRLVVLAPDNRIVASIPAGSKDWLTVVGEYDMDGNGTREALISFYSGGGHCCTTGCFVDTGSNPRQLGGYEATHGDCGEAGDRDADGRTDFVSRDFSLAYFEGSFGESPDLPFAYGYRDGRFVDLTREICGAELREIMAAGRKYLREDPSRYPRYQDVRNAVNMWYIAATVFGEEQQAVVEITRLLTPEGRARFMSNMKERRECAAQRRKLLWTGVRKDLL